MQQLISLVRLAHKYQGDKLLTECVSRLKVEFPTQLALFQQLYPPRVAVSIIHGRAPLVKNLDDMVNLINNALDLGIECILPCAYYLLLIKFKPQVRLRVHYSFPVADFSSCGYRKLLALSSSPTVHKSS